MLGRLRKLAPRAGLRPYGPPAVEAEPRAEGCGVIPGFGKDDIQAVSANKARRSAHAQPPYLAPPPTHPPLPHAVCAEQETQEPERKRSVRWTDTLSSHGGSENGGGGALGPDGASRKTESVAGNTAVTSSTNASLRDDVSRAVSEVGDSYSGTKAPHSAQAFAPFGERGACAVAQQPEHRRAEAPQDPSAVTTVGSRGGKGSATCVLV